MSVVDLKLNELVSQNYIYASVLHYFGIQFYNYSENTLAEVCLSKGLNVRQVIQSLEDVHQKTHQEISLINYPVDLIIQYLKHSHFIFIQRKLPYMARLIEDLEIEKIGKPQLVRDLQLLFPLFVEDFIHHIHEEEDTFFKYILILHQASLGKYQVTQLYQEMEQNSLQYFVLDHHTHDDEMSGIREITNNYELSPQASLHLKVLFSELKSLETELINHAKIEDEILCVKALKLEMLVKTMLKQKIKFN